MRALRIKRAAFLAGSSLLVMIQLGACVPAPAPGNGYSVCDDVTNVAACPDKTTPVSVDNSQ